ncbi:MAG TPA: hypothetical protein VKB19_11260 [Pedobacter sp.]|nr:hypothetical protein [Pedobacter sp.]
MAVSFKSEDLVKFYSDSLIKLIESVSKVIYIAFFFILFCWIYIIEGLNIRYEAFNADHNKQIENLTAQLKTQKKKLYTLNYINDRRPVLGENRDTALLKSSKRTQLDIPYAKSLIEKETASTVLSPDTLAKKIARLKSEIDNASSMLEQKEFNDVIKDIPFPFKTIFYFTSSLKNGPQSLIILITLLLIYVYFSRIKVLKYSARMIRIIKSDESFQINPHRDISVTNPFWSSPIPIKSIHISDDEYLEFTGNKGNKYTYVIFLYAIFVILLGIEIRMLWLQTSYNLVSPFNKLFFASFFMVVLSICFVIDWISKWRIPDNLNNEKNAVNYNRRRFVLASGSITLMLGVYFCSNKISKFIRPLKRRIKAVLALMNKKEFFGNFVRNSNTKNYHFFDEKGHNPTVKFATKKGWENFERKSKVTLNTQVLRRLTANREYINPWMLEHLALSLIKDGKYEEAFTLLNERIAEYVQSIRLWDLFAKIYFVSLKADPKYAETFKKLCKASDYYDPILKQRIIKFNSEQWQKKLVLKNKHIFNKQNLSGKNVF